MHCLSHDRALVMPQGGTKPPCRSIHPTHPPQSWLWHSSCLAQSLFPCSAQGGAFSDPRSCTPPEPDRYQSCAELAWQSSPCTCRDTGRAAQPSPADQASRYSRDLKHQALLFFCPCLSLLCGPQDGWSLQRCRVHPPVVTAPLIPQEGQTAETLHPQSSSVLLRQGGSRVLRVQPLLFSL